VEIYIVQGRHGELSAHRHPAAALDAWAKTNGFPNYFEFFNEFNDPNGEDGQMEFTEDRKGHVTHWFLDESGQVTAVTLD
jgi:hypothetical protein